MTSKNANRDQVRRAAQTRRLRRERRRRLFGVLAGAAVLTLLIVGMATLLKEGGGGSDREGSEPAASWNAPSFTGGPRLAADQSEVDHGDVPYGYEAAARYRLKNVGDQLLRIENPEVTILDGC